MHYESNAGHAGGNLSALDILLCLHHAVIKKDDLFVRYNHIKRWRSNVKSYGQSTFSRCATAEPYDKNLRNERPQTGHSTLSPL